jgi:hypothetical protein
VLIIPSSWGSQLGGHLHAITPLQQNLIELKQIQTNHSHNRYRIFVVACQKSHQKSKKVKILEDNYQGREKKLLIAASYTVTGLAHTEELSWSTRPERRKLDGGKINKIIYLLT